MADLFVHSDLECKRVKGWGWTYDERRNMWVCSTCYQPHRLNWANNPDCLWCGEIFTLDVFSVKALNNSACPDCGGTNYATPDSVNDKKRRDLAHG